VLQRAAQITDMCVPLPQVMLTRLGLPELALDLLECSDVEPGIWSVVPDQPYWLLLARTAKVYSIRWAAVHACMLSCTLCSTRSRRRPQEQVPPAAGAHHPAACGGLCL
jgi:hypothetical protein